MIVGIDHFGILVDNIDRSTGMYVSYFGYTLDKTLKMESVGLTVAFLHLGEINIELVAYTGDASQTEFSRYIMGEEMGYNHICYAVDDLVQTLSNLDRAGIKPIEGFPMQGGHGQIAFLNPKDTGGTLIELCEPSD
jgi:methylmalonyl-CoA/ethylmalonyl-CoA epimerase